MPITNFSLFLSVTFIVSASPGPVMLSCMSNGARLGLQKAFVGMMAASAGNLLLVLLSALGLGFIISQNDLLFNLIKWVGAGYLVFLGVQIIRISTNLDNSNDLNNSEVAAALTSSSSVWWSSFFIAISNPKGLIYFGALFPQFINYQQPLAAQFTVLTLTFLITDLVWMLIYALAGNKIMMWLKAPTHQKWFNNVSGFVLIAAGIFMALSGHIR